MAGGGGGGGGGNFYNFGHSEEGCFLGMVWYLDVGNMK